MFAREERRKVLAEMGNMVVGEVKEMGRRWGLMDQQAKEKYEAAYQRDKVRYEEEMRNYQPSQQFLDMKAKHDMLKKGTDGGLEKYFTFLSSEWRKIKEDNPEFGVKEVQDRAWMEWTKGKELMRERKVKKVVDPAAPKKPLTVFFLFQKKMRKGG